jgi:ribosomal 30S subunit maturation factor RimM
MVEQHVVTVDIDAVIREGLTVYDAGGEKIGVVREYSPSAAYLVVQTGLVSHKDLYIPYSAIRSIDPHDLFLTLDKATLAGDYSAPPPATIVVEGETARTFVPDGYAGRPAEFNSVDLEMLRRDLDKGMPVYSSDDEKIGTVDGIDTAAGYMLVKKNRFSKQDFVIPFAAIAGLVLGEVHLAVSRDVMQKEYAQLPRDAVLRVDVVGAPGAGTVGVAVVEQ